jgi:hypothetical protein
METIITFIPVIYIICAVIFGFLATRHFIRDIGTPLDTETAAMSVAVFFVAGFMWWFFVPLLTLGFLVKLIVNRRMK